MSDNETINPAVNSAPVLSPPSWIDGLGLDLIAVGSLASLGYGLWQIYQPAVYVFVGIVGFVFSFIRTKGGLK